MKKQLLFLFVMMGTLTMQADKPTYPYLAFRMTDGAVSYVPISSLNIAISGNTLIAGNKTFVLSNLSAMYFSVSGETVGVKPTHLDWNDVIDIYDLNGHKVTREQMQQGVYIIKSKSGTYKLIVK